MTQKPRFAINGYGRIGRSSLRVWLSRFSTEADLVAINTSGSLNMAGIAHLTKYDTSYRILSNQISFEEVSTPDKLTDDNPLLGYLTIDDFRIPVLGQRDPLKIPWKKYSPDVIIEATGAFRSQADAQKHLTAGARGVVISAPPKDATPTAIIGVNEDKLFKGDRSSRMTVVSNASCTTNSVAPVADVIHKHLGVRKAMLTTVHGYTDDQNLQDNSHKDLRRARAAAQNIVPTSTGAAISTTEAVPDLKGLFDGIALRVPVITGSITDFTFVTEKTTSVSEVNEILTEASRLPQYQGILAVTSDPIVSSDIIGRPESSIVDLDLTRVVDGDLVKILAWYDNEWGYTNRLVEQTLKLAENLH